MTIIFVVDVFPCISETFILNQITGLIDLGHDVIVLSASRHKEKDVHDDIAKYELLKRTYYFNDAPDNKFTRIVVAAFLLLAYGHRNPRAAFSSLNCFKYGAAALSLNYFYKVMLFLRLPKADIILCHYGSNGNFAAMMKELGIPGQLITMFHGYDIRLGISRPGLYRPLFEKARAILSISDYNHRHLLAFGAPVDRIHHHPVGIDIPRYDTPTRALPAQNATVRIVTVSRLVPEKGLRYGLEAVRKLVFDRKVAHIEYYIVGDGPLRQELQDLADKHQLKSQVLFLGRQTQSDVIRTLKNSHIFFLPSVAEALPVVLMEAQASRLPVVASDVGSVSQVLSRHSGFVVPPMDAEAMAAKLQYLVLHPQEWHAMGEAGHRHVRQHYDIRLLNQRLVNLCEELCEPASQDHSLTSSGVRL